MVHGPTFLARYQRWWGRNEGLSVADVEFAVLILRVCAYAAHFLPSHTTNVDAIRGQPLSDIRRITSEIANNLAEACSPLDPNGSLVRVQHMLFCALTASCEGRTDLFWDGLVTASRAALRAGIHTDAAAPGYYGSEKLERELNRRTLCALFFLDW